VKEKTLALQVYNSVDSDRNTANTTGSFVESTEMGGDEQNDENKQQEQNIKKAPRKATAWPRV
jgi:hypothetical protein